MCFCAGAGEGDDEVVENGSPNGIIDFIQSRKPSTKSRNGSNKEITDTPLIEVINHSK